MTIVTAEGASIELERYDARHIRLSIQLSPTTKRQSAILDKEEAATVITAIKERAKTLK